ncbi:MAG TPA: hypothetical protein VHV74_10965 [Pseudonocardiaceae bacterium]|jgi:hypothetical protein|nr:hypothetical protein [Pseudonocardiaceae bacterium]
MTACALAAATGAGLLIGTAGPATASQPADHPGKSRCSLANGIKHVISIQFDNVHFSRDNPNVPSDLEQMPNLLNFLEHNGTVLSNDHDVLVHTATNFVSALTGLYEDRTSITQSNSFSYFDPTGNPHTGESFTYWTDPLDDPAGNSTDTNFNMNYTANPAANPTNTNIDTPAPWVPYTRAGCDVGQVGMANTVLENVTTDIPTVFGANSPQQAEAIANPTKATADFVGLAVHCAAGSSVCASGQTDALPDEPGGYAGHRALFGAAEIAPAISPSQPLSSLSGQPITDESGNLGFPGFDSLTPDNSLGFAAKMQESGIPVTNVYISDVHGDHTAADTGDLGPGEPIYEQQLHDYDSAFGRFLARLKTDGITPANTLFSVTTDEGDHFSGSAPTPAHCTGAPGNTCSYTTKSEVNVNLPGLLATQANDTTPFAIHSDPAPAFWVNGNPAPNAPSVRTLERDISGLSFTNPLTGGTDKVANQLADPVEEKILHFVGPDAARTPSFTAFSGEDEFVTSGAQNCTRPCVFTSSFFAWNHGGLFPDMDTIFMALVGPGVRNRGVDPSTWTDQVDLRPTLMALTGLHDDYQVDGRVLVEDLNSNRLPHALRSDGGTVARLGEVYKQIEAVDGEFGMATLAASTHGVASGSTASDVTYTKTEHALSELGQRRDRLAGQIQTVLLGAEFGNHRISSSANELIRQADDLLSDANHLAHQH